MIQHATCTQKIELIAETIIPLTMGNCVMLTDHLLYI